MKKHSAFNWIFLAPFVLAVACKKADAPVDTSGGGGSTTPPVEVPQDPPVANTMGFFLDDWSAKVFATPTAKDAATASGDPTTTVNIDPAKVLTKIPKYLFGNNANPYMGQLVTEPVLMNHIKNLSPKILRFPGGNISSVYIWNAAPNNHSADVPDTLVDGSGKKFLNGYWYGGNTAGWTLSLDNYYAALQQTGSTGIITLNYGYARYGTSADPVAAAAHLAADWVRYDKGRTKFWEVGNESYGSWQAGYRIDVSRNKDGQPEIQSGALYGKHFKVFADSMRKAAKEINATIQIGSVLVESNGADSYDPVSRDWNSGVFANAGNTPDFFIVHNYFTPYNQNSTADMILPTAASETARMLNYVKNGAQAAGVTMKPLALTEWNIFAIGSRQMVSNVAGIHADLVLGELLKNKFGMSSRWDLANGWSNGDDHGLFNKGDEPGAVKWNPRPAFYHMYYFQQTSGDRLITSTTQGDTSIVSYASSFSSGELGVALINRGTKAQVAKLAFSNFTPGKKYYWYTLTGGTDNGEFSGSVFVNGNGPSGTSGGPDMYASLPANAASAQGTIQLAVPPRAVVFVVVEKK